MSLMKIREERKELGGTARRGPKTIVLLLLLALVIFLISYLSRF